MIQIAPPAPSQTTDAYDLHCMEVFGGNQAFSNAVSTPGFDVFITAVPYQGGEGGGDVHYLSMCAGGRITRFVLADLSGHGMTVDDSAKSLRKLVRKNINTTDQSGLIRQLNKGVLADEGGSRFATAVLATYFAPTKTLLATVAGHPCPLWYQAEKQQWVLLSPECEGVLNSGNSDAGRNLPLGVVEPTDFSQMQVPLGVDDMIVLYSDVMIEASDANGRMLGEEGLLEIANELPSDILMQDIAPALIKRVKAHAQSEELDDDLTMVVMHHSGETGRKIGVGEKLAALGKMLGIGE
ncbi:MAG: PP2C family protein-serine/threonine phosphatase [Planctomycetota bacterium]